MNSLTLKEVQCQRTNHQTHLSKAYFILLKTVPTYAMVVLEFMGCQSKIRCQFDLSIKFYHI